MNSKPYKVNKRMMVFCVSLVIFVFFFNFIIGNDAVRKAVIDFTLPLLEKFHHQPEMEIISIETHPDGFL